MELGYYILKHVFVSHFNTPAFHLQTKTQYRGKDYVKQSYVIENTMASNGVKIVTTPYWYF